MNKTRINKWFVSVGVAAALAMVVLPLTADAKKNKRAGTLKGMVKVDGSSTVFPISEAMGEEFGKVHPRVRVTVGLSGTGGGMKKFTVGDIDVTGASRPIKEIERTKAKTNKPPIDFVELPVAYDGIAVVVSAKNKFVDKLTVQELKKIWQPNSPVKQWSDVRQGWPKKPIKLYGPGADSGTFDYFTKTIVGKERATRSDFTASEDDNVLVQGVKSNPHALGYFGYAYYAENKKVLRAIPIDPGSGAVTPSVATIENATYKPLSRPIFIYVSKASARRPEVESFVTFYLQNARKFVPEVGYVPFQANVYQAAMKRFQKRMLGTVFGASTAKKGKNLVELLAMKGE